MIRYDSALKELLTAFLFGQPGLSVYAFCRKQDNYLAAVSICLKQKQKQKKNQKNPFFPNEEHIQLNSHGRLPLCY